MATRTRSAVRRVAALVRLGGLCSLGLIASCGGGTSQVSNFVPGRLIVFGDDTSSIGPTGLKQNVNGLTATGNFDCTLEPIWVQTIASNYGFAFAQCNPQAATPRAIMLAQPGAKIADVAAQVDAQVNNGGFLPNDLATIEGGQNDLWALYAQYPGRSLDSLKAEAAADGAALARVVNRLVGFGVRVIVADLPPLGMTPYALQQEALVNPNGIVETDPVSLMNVLSQSFNNQLGVTMVLDGRYVGLVQASLRFQAIGVSPNGFGFSDIADPICTQPVPLCTSNTLVAGATTTAYLWADNYNMSTGGQNQLSSLALARIRGNPF
ncbi:MAG: esterase [Burkholderiales bacterium]|nr:esterase [Burkholderiales bacterium]MDE1926960.1 esterase [Burkholderiales bacterium]MDE2157671.1 esterase [Burkholderiales bacterium]MDE2503036.1 esterase [Burkholderiales bacterium]